MLKQTLIFTRTFWKKLTNLLNCIRQFFYDLCTLVFIFVIVVMCGTCVYFYIKNPPNITKKPEILLVNLSGGVYDTAPFSQLSHGWFNKHLSKLPVIGNSLFDIVNSIRQAKSDPQIKGIVLMLDEFTGTDITSLQYIGKALKEFRANNKPIYSFCNDYTASQYYLASFSDQISLSTNGSVYLHGFSSQQLYHKSLLEKLKVTVNVFRVGTHKSAVEPFLRDDMSHEVRKDAQERLQNLWDVYVSDIAKNRSLPVEVLSKDSQTYLDELSALQGDQAKYALSKRLVDQLISPQKFHDKLKEIFGQKESLKTVSIYDYVPSRSVNLLCDRKKRSNDVNHIAVVLINGTITNDYQYSNSVGSKTTIKLLRRARFNDKIKALVVRINSPGGGVTAAEAIRSEIAAIRAAGKPVVVSMGGVAASGGYWLASPANHIIASPITLTGSIGIFCIVNTFDKTLHSVGINTDGVATSPLAGLNITQPLTPEMRRLLQINIENGYLNFIKLIAESRHKSLDEIEKVAQGRVWLGRDAQQKGLVDQLGDFDDAVVKAAALAKITYYQLTWLTPQPMGWLEYLIGTENARMLKLLLTSNTATILPTLLKQSHLANYFNDPKNRYAICFDCAINEI